MAELREDHEIVTDFLLGTCGLRSLLNYGALQSLSTCSMYTNRATQRGLTYDEKTENIRFVTGSVAEFYIQPMLSCVGDVDIMFHRSDQLAIPAGTAPPTQLPDEFHRWVIVCEIVDSEFPGYVYMPLSYLLTECIDDGKFSAAQCKLGYATRKVDEESHGPAFLESWSDLFPPMVGRVSGADFSRDVVYCMRCLSWPPQVADWPARHRNYGWPDSATVDRVVSNGCDVVRKAHHKCRQDERMHRLSFSRAEIVLLNSWIPVQQILYHMLRVFVKIELLTDSANNSDKAIALSNYHIKTLMLWACELKPRSWWTDDLNIVRLSVELLHTLGVWLTEARCPHYFIHNCNLFDHPDNWYCDIASRLASETEASLADWFINNYIRRCAQLCPGSVSQLFDDIIDKAKLQTAVSAVIDWRLNESLVLALCLFTENQHTITFVASCFSLTLRSCLYWMRDMAKSDQRLSIFFAATAFLHVAYKHIGDPLTDELLDVLATICLRSNHVRRCLNARHSSVLSLSQASILMKVVANNSCSTVQLIQIELSKAYLYRALRCEDSESDSIYCLAHVYLAVLYYVTEHYQTSIDHCTLATRLQDHLQCSLHAVQGELLPKIDDDIDTVLGLSVFYQYVRTAALNQQQQPQHVRAFTTELFAHYLQIRSLSVMRCCQLIQTSPADEIQPYQKCIYELQEIFTSDALMLNFAMRRFAKYKAKNRRQTVVSGQTMPELSHQLDTSELVKLLQQSAVEHLTAFRQLEAKEFGSIRDIVTTDFEALYAYKRGEYQRCLQLSTHNVRTLIDVEGLSRVFAYPEFIQLMDDDIVSLIGLALVVDPSLREDGHAVDVSVSQLPLSLYLMTQCQMKLSHPVISLTQTLDYVEVARLNLNEHWTLDQLLLKLVERKILLYMKHFSDDSSPIKDTSYNLSSLTVITSPTV